MEDIPANTEICYYSGTLIPAEHGTSNYCIDLGVHYHCKLVIDGSPEDAREPQLGCMQTVNHSCDPNCTAEHRETQDGLGILCLAASRDIQEGESITFSYGGSFWSNGPPARAHRGHKIVYCLCQGAACPNALWRKGRDATVDGPSHLDRLKRRGERRPRHPETYCTPLEDNTPLGVTSTVDPERQPKASHNQGSVGAPSLPHNASSYVIPKRKECRYDVGPPHAALETADRLTKQVLESSELPSRRGGESDHAPLTVPSSGAGTQPECETIDGRAPTRSEASRTSSGGQSSEAPDPPAQRNPFVDGLLDHLAPWTPGTRVVYRKPRGGQSRSAETGFPIWAVAGQPPLEAMFQAADQIRENVFYVAADQWSGARLVKEFGAFATAEEFLSTLRRSPVRCYYEIIRAGTPCKAYLDVEADKGILNREAGEMLLGTTLKLWTDLVCSRWPSCVQECSKALEPLVLDDSRPTKDG